MRRKYNIFITCGLRWAICTLLYVTPCYGQGATPSQVSDIVNSAFGNFFGGEIAVRDAVVRGQTTAIKHDTVIEVIKQTAMLVDMLLQAVTGGAPGNETTQILINRQAEEGQAGSILYGRYDPGLWTGTYKEDIVYKNGEWNEDETLRDHIRLTTQMDNMMLLRLRQDGFAADMDHLRRVQEAIDGCESRNCAIQASGDAAVANAWQQLQTQQVLMTLTSALAVAEGGKINDVTQKRAQEKYFITNGGATLSFPQFVDRGLR